MLVIIEIFLVVKIIVTILVIVSQINNCSLFFHSLGVNTKTTSIPQEKALVERTFGTLQRRWPQIIRLLDLKNIEQLNNYLPHLIQEYNQDFSIPLDQLESVTRKFDQDEDIVFSYRSERIIYNGHSINFKKDKWFIWKGFTPIYFKQNLKVMVIEIYK